MANWSDLKSAVASIVKTNGNKEITGQLLQNVLLNIISTVGLNSSFAGIATPKTNPGTPDGNVFYLASKEGTYSNFNGIVIHPGEAVILEWKGSWVKKDSGFATQEKLSELELIHGTLKKNELYICDSNGYIIMKLDREGLDTIPSNELVKRLESKFGLLSEQRDKLYVCDKDGNVVASIINGEFNCVPSNELVKRLESKFGLLSEQKDKLYVCDYKGNVVLSIIDGKINFIPSEGLLEQLGKKTTPLSGKTFVALGASLTTGGKWQRSLAESTGMLFLENVHANVPCAYGGSATYGGIMGQQDRARRLREYVEANNIQLDVILIENGNDMNKANQDVDIDNDKPWFWQQTVTYNGYTASSYGEAISYFKNNINSVLSGVTRLTGTRVNMPYSSGTTANVKVENDCRSGGVLTIKVGERVYGIALESGMFISQIVGKIMEYNYEGYNDEKASDGRSVNFSTNTGNASVLVVSNTSDVVISVTNVNIPKYVNMSYKELTTDNWLNIEAWDESWSVESLTRCYKGLLEYINKNFPTTKVVWIGLPHYIYDFDNGAKREDGSYNVDAYLSSSYAKNEAKLYALQHDICIRYRVPFVNLSENTSISLVNAKQYYNSNDVHPKDNAYKLWGEELATLLI